MLCETHPARERPGLLRLQALLEPDIHLEIFPSPAIQPDRDLRRVEQWEAAAELDHRGIAPPFWPIGHSFGGIVALELAHHLTTAGRPVAYVGMIDTWRPSSTPAPLPKSC